MKDTLDNLEHAYAELKTQSRFSNNGPWDVHAVKDMTRLGLRVLFYIARQVAREGQS